MERCEDFEVGIEMRLHGALDVPGTESLVAHLATCASCRAFEELAKGSETMMNQQANVHLQTLDWDGLWKRTKSFVERQSRDRLLAGAVVALTLAPMAMLMNDDVLSAVGIVTLSAAVIGSRLLASRRALAATAKYQGNTGELLFFYRRELEDRLRATRKALVLGPLWLALLAGRLGHPFASPRQWVGFAGMGVVMVGASAYVWLVRRPRLARELESLKADLQPR